MRVNTGAVRLYVDKLDYEVLEVIPPRSHTKRAVLRMRKKLGCGQAESAAGVEPEEAPLVQPLGEAGELALA